MISLVETRPRATPFSRTSPCIARRVARPLWTALPSLCLAAAASSFARPAPGARLHLEKCLVVHRHGDRTPITPLKDEDYWRRQLPAPAVLEGIARGTALVRRPGDGPREHGAAGRGPFGQLTTAGVLQMVRLGERLREELEEPPGDGEEDARADDEGRLFTRREPLVPSRVRCMSTDFPRTIQSAQALLTGLFPEAGGPIEIDLRDTSSYFIPDPQPRQSSRQLSLERYLSQRPHVTARDEEMRGFARRVTDELRGCLGEGATGVSYGIGEEKEASSSAARPPLAWAQLAEILVCLHARGRLPPALSEEDVRVASDHVAWKWRQSLREPVLAKTAMWKFASHLVDALGRKAGERRDDASTAAEERDGGAGEEPRLRLYSAHDSTLLGLLCVLRLEQPAEWPEYGSFLKVELLREEEDEARGAGEEEWWVRFSLNGQELRSEWLTDERGAPATLVPFHRLAEMIHTEHTLKEEGSGESSLKYSWKAGTLTEH